jgi:hypothetical protein
MLGGETSYQVLYPLRVDQVVLSRLFAWEGAVALVTPEFDGCYVSSEFPTFEVNRERALPEYIGHVLRWPTFHNQLAGVTRGLGQRRQRVHAEEFLALSVPLPPIPTQARIVEHLNRVSSVSAQTQERLNRCPPDLIYGLLPGSIDTVIETRASSHQSVRELADFVSDTVHPGDDPGPATEFVGLQHVEGHTGRWLGSDPLSSLKGRKFRFRPGDVVYGYLRPYQNKVWVADRHGLCSVDQYVLRPRRGVDARVLAYALRGRRTLATAIDLTHSLQLPRLRSGLLGAIELPTVAEEDTAATVAQLDAVRDRVVRAAEVRRHQQELAGALVPAALNEAFAGVS